jgi:hypothetical protein
MAVRADASWKRDEGKTPTRMTPEREAFSSTAAFRPIDQDIRSRRIFKCGIKCCTGSRH